MQISEKGSLAELSWKEMLQILGAVLFLASLPFHRELNEKTTVFFLVSCLPCFSYPLFRAQWKNILVFSSIYLLALISSIYAPDVKSALNDLGIESTLLLMPAVMGMSYRSSPLKDNIIKISFIAGVMSALLYLAFVFFTKMKLHEVSPSRWFAEEQLNHQYSFPIGIHATFFSAYISLSLYLLLSYLLSIRSFLLKTAIVLLVLLSIFSLLMLSSRIVLLITFVSILLLLLMQIKRGRWTIAFFIGAIIVFPLTFFWKESAYFQKRFRAELEKDVKWKEVQIILKHPMTAGKDSILKNDGSRIERWVAAMQVIKESPWIGYGTGQEKPVLYKKYNEMGLLVTLEKGYDSHNQFMSYVIRSGILGLIVFLGMLVFGCVLAIRRRNYEYLFFLVLIIGVSLTENFLASNKGIVFFAFFNSFFFLSQCRKRGSQTLLGTI